MSIKLLKLVNGDDVIGDVDETSPTFFLIKKPALIGMQPNQHGQVSLGLADMLPLSDDKDVRIERVHVLYATTPKMDLRNAYSQMFGSGLIAATPGSLLTSPR